MLVFGILLIFCISSTPDSTVHLTDGQRSEITREMAMESSNQDSSVLTDPSRKYEPRFKRKFRDLPEMNFPPGFYMVAMPLMHLLLMYIIGIIINDYSREEKEGVEKTFGTFN